jgi:membrane associated rhomboid family serine protease
LKTIRNYTAQKGLFAAYGFSFATGIAAIATQVSAPGFAQQGLDLIDSKFLYFMLTQLAHLGWAHLTMNLAGMALVAWGFSAHRSSPQWLLIQTSAFFWMAFYLIHIEPMTWYGGLSGAIHFQFAACLVLAWSNTPGIWATRWPLALLSAGLAVKLLIEWNGSTNIDPLIGGPVAYEAHRGGAIGGVVLGLFLLLMRRAKKNLSASA